ncbi:MAG: SUF system NifU family Fe-S cluster assembly protein [Parcubacteria group bacterium]|jgi:nitrogen fixation NifU-like protein
MNIYQEKILDHYHNPRNAGTIDAPTHKCCADNPTCGDKICVTLMIDDDHITDVKFTGDGCAISQAAASLVTEKISGNTVVNALKLTRNDITEMLGVEIGIGRIKCALLGIETIQKAIQCGQVDKN